MAVDAVHMEMTAVITEHSLGCQGPPRRAEADSKERWVSQWCGVSQVKRGTSQGGEPGRTTGIIVSPVRLEAADHGRRQVCRCWGGKILPCLSQSRTVRMKDESQVLSLQRSLNISSTSTHNPVTMADNGPLQAVLSFQGLRAEVH